MGSRFPAPHQARAPQQTNGHDCGVYTLAVAEAVASRFCHGAAAAGDDGDRAARWFEAAMGAVAPDMTEADAAAAAASGAASNPPLRRELTPSRIVAKRREVRTMRARESLADRRLWASCQRALFCTPRTPRACVVNPERGVRS